MMTKPTFRRPFFAINERLGQARPLNGASPGQREPAHRICPRLGTAVDAETAYNFPAELNYCYQVKPATSVQLHHQVSYCLSPNHIRCPLYRHQEVLVLPTKGHKLKRLRLWPSKARQPRPPQPYRSLLPLAPILLFVAAAFLLAAGWYYRVGVAAWLPAVARLPAAAIRNPSPSPTGELPAVLPPATSTPLVGTPPAPPSLTPTRTATPAPTPTTRPSATATITTLPSPTPATVGLLETAAATVTATPSLTAGTCAPPDGWTTYTVQPNDSLFRLGRRFGIPYVELQEANCMGGSKVIYVGQRLFVPDLSATATPGPTRPLPADMP